MRALPATAQHMYTTLHYEYVRNAGRRNWHGIRGDATRLDSTRVYALMPIRGALAMRALCTNPISRRRNIRLLSAAARHEAHTMSRRAARRRAPHTVQYTVLVHTEYCCVQIISNLPNESIRKYVFTIYRCCAIRTRTSTTHY